MVLENNTAQYVILFYPRCTIRNYLPLMLIWILFHSAYYQKLFTICWYYHFVIKSYCSYHDLDIQQFFNNFKIGNEIVSEMVSNTIWDEGILYRLLYWRYYAYWRYYKYFLLSWKFAWYYCDFMIESGGDAHAKKNVLEVRAKYGKIASFF